MKTELKIDKETILPLDSGSNEPDMGLLVPASTNVPSALAAEVSLAEDDARAEIEARRIAEDERRHREAEAARRKPAHLD